MTKIERLPVADTNGKPRGPIARRAADAAIDFEPNVQRGPGMLLDQLQLLRLVGHQPQLVLGGQLDIVGRKGPFQHQDRLGD